MQERRLLSNCKLLLLSEFFKFIKIEQSYTASASIYIFVVKVAL